MPNLASNALLVRAQILPSAKDLIVAWHNLAALTPTDFLKVNYGDETYSRSHAA
jgi:hypothetical protein